jgi:ABC-type branched-subunit amino acid transport system substrate-binding protein
MMINGNAISRALIFFAALAMAITGSCRPASAADLNDQEKRGKRVYFEGKGEGGNIIAYVGRDATPVPAFALPCANCHGYDGLGRPEGGVIPSDITWSHLIKSYGHHHANGRKHATFTKKTVGEAITGGIDPSGNVLEVTMPRYKMAATDLADLIAYLIRLETDFDPGLTEDLVRIGTVLPLEGRLASVGRAMKGVIEAYFSDVNVKGGIHGRRLKLVVASYPERLDAHRAAMKHLISDEDVFALVSAFTAGVEKDMSALIENEKIPLIGPFTSLPGESSSLDRFTFYLFSGLREQSRVLVNYAAQYLNLQTHRFVVIHPSGNGKREITEAVLEQAKKRGWNEPSAATYPPGRFEAVTMTRQLKEQDTKLVLFLGPQPDLATFFRAIDASGWRPYVLLPGSLASRAVLDLPDSFANRIFLAYPTLPLGLDNRRAREFDDLLNRHQLSPRHLAVQISAYTATKVLVEGLKRSGKDLSRNKLVAILEGCHEFEPGLTPPISYGPNRRVGVLGAYVVSVDLKSRRIGKESVWIALD